jgi:hypothetical protein
MDEWRTDHGHQKIFRSKNSVFYFIGLMPIMNTFFPAAYKLMSAEYFCYNGQT